MLLTESQVAEILRITGVRLSVRTLTVLGHLVRVVNRNGVFYVRRDVQNVLMDQVQDVIPVGYVSTLKAA